MVFGCGGRKSGNKGVGDVKEGSRSGRRRGWLRIQQMVADRVEDFSGGRG